MNNKISIIIPTFNSESYISRCLDSIKDQTKAPYEIIIVNDGSTDNTLKILKEYKKLKLDIITIENHGQGYARNLALKKATGDYIWFVDSDDAIFPNAIEILTKIVEEEKNIDVINFQYEITNLKGESKKYSKFATQPYIVEGKECSILLNTKPYFTVNDLYRKEFLIKNDIRYGEGYIYEDIEFWVKVAVKANKVVFLKEQLYKVVKEGTSTTNANRLTDKHYKNFLKATQACLDCVKDNSDINIKYLNKYLLNRFLLYYAKRTPKNNKKEFLHKFVDIMHDYKIKDVQNKFWNRLIRYKIFEKKKYFVFYIFTTLYCKKKYGNK